MRTEVLLAVGEIERWSSEASASELAEHTHTDFAPLGRRFALVMSGLHATIELRDPRRLTVTIAWPVHAGNELRCTACTAIGEFYYHTSVTTPSCVGYFFQRLSA